MLQIKKGVDPSSLPVFKTVKNPSVPNKVGAPAATIASTQDPARLAASLNNPARKASVATPAATPSRAEPPKTQSKPKAAGSSSGSAKAAERRNAHTGHASVTPEGRERGGGGSGGSQRNGHPDIQDWMPFSAQQSRIARIHRTYPATGLANLANLAKAVPHPLQPLRAAVFSLASRFYSEVLPSLFRRTPREAEQNQREIRKDVLRKEQKQRSDRSEARRDIIRKRAESEPHLALAGDLTTMFSTR